MIKILTVMLLEYQILRNQHIIAMTIKLFTLFGTGPVFTSITYLAYGSCCSSSPEESRPAISLASPSMARQKAIVIFSAYALRSAPSRALA